MFNKNLSKAVNKNELRPHLNYVYYNKTAGEYVATNGFIMLIEKTADTYDTDKFLSPLTGLPVPDDYTFPDYQKIIPASGDIITNRVFKTYIRTKKSKDHANKIIQIADMFFDFKYLSVVFNFIGSDFILTVAGSIEPLKFVSFDGLRTAVIMPIVLSDLSDYTTAEDIDTASTKRGRTKGAKYIYIAFDVSGAVRGVFNKESDACKEATGGVKEFPLI